MAYTAVNNLAPVHPGEILAEDLAALAMSAIRFAKHIGVPPDAITAIINGQRGVSAEVALRLAKAFRATEKYWMNLQANYDAKLARAKLGDRVEAIEPLYGAAA